MQAACEAVEAAPAELAACVAVEAAPAVLVGRAVSMRQHMTRRKGRVPGACRRRSGARCFERPAQALMRKGSMQWVGRPPFPPGDE